VYKKCLSSLTFSVISSLLSRDCTFSSKQTGLVLYETGMSVFFLVYMRAKFRSSEEIDAWIQLLQKVLSIQPFAAHSFIKDTVLKNDFEVLPSEDFIGKRYPEESSYFHESHYREYLQQAEILSELRTRSVAVSQVGSYLFTERNLGAQIQKHTPDDVFCIFRDLVCYSFAVLYENHSKFTDIYVSLDDLVNMFISRLFEEIYEYENKDNTNIVEEDRVLPERCVDLLASLSRLESLTLKNLLRQNDFVAVSIHMYLGEQSPLPSIAKTTGCVKNVSSVNFLCSTAFLEILCNLVADLDSISEQYLSELSLAMINHNSFRSALESVSCSDLQFAERLQNKLNE